MRLNSFEIVLHKTYLKPLTQTHYMIEEKIIEILKDKEVTYFELKEELKIYFGSLDYYLLKLKKENKIKSVKKEGETYYSMR